MAAAIIPKAHESAWGRVSAILGYAVASAIILAFFVRFVVPGYRGRFAPDDMMNIEYFWGPGPWALLRGLLVFFSTYSRPMGGVFYSVVYYFFGLNPLPYHIVIDVLILINCFLAFRFAFLVSGSRLIGGMTALLLICHAALAWLVYLPSFVFDVLCFTFFFLTLNYYISIRNSGARLTRKQIAIVILLYIGALESKEMAVTLPVIALLYEAIWFGPRWRSWPDVRRWIAGEAWLPLLLGAITIPYVAGKTLLPGAVTEISAYRPALNLRMFAQSNMRFVNEIFYVPAAAPLSERQCLLVWAALLYLAWRGREKHLWLAAFFVLIAPLPIDFVPGRGGACLYIPLVGWMMVVATLVPALASVLKKEPPFRRVPIAALRTAVALLAVPFLWIITAHQYAIPQLSLTGNGHLTWTVIQELKAIQPSVKPHTRIAFLSDPFGTWDIKFISDLTYHDRTVVSWPAHEVPLTPAQIAQFDIVFAWDHGRLVRLRPNPAAAPLFAGNL